MSGAHGNGAAAKGPPKGDDKKDDTIVKVTAVVIATGIGYSLYKSVFVGKKEERAHGYPKGEPFHEQINIGKPDGLSRFEAGVKEKVGEFKGGVGEFKGGVKEKVGEFKGGVKDKFGAAKEKAGEFKGGVEEKGKEAKYAAEEKGREAKYAAEEKGREAKYAADEKRREAKYAAEEAEEDVKEAVEEGREKAAVQEGKTQQQWGGWFSWLGGQANKEKDEAAAKAEKAKEETKRTVEDGEKSAEVKGKNFFDKADEELIREKEAIQKGLASAEGKVERAGAAVANKVHKLAPGGKPHGGKPKKAYKEYYIVRGDTLWGISRRYGVSIDELKSENGIWNADYIVAGDTLTIPK